MDKAEEQRILSTASDWREWGDQFGWELLGSTYEHHATFVLPSGSTFQVKAEARRGIDRRLTELMMGQ